MQYIIFNGKILKEDTPLLGANSRALRFGDGLFETMRYHNGDISLWDEHMYRFFKGAKNLKFETKKFFTVESLREQIFSLLHKNNHQHARIRLTAFRGDGGLFDPINLQPNYIIQTSSLSPDFGAFNENGLQVTFYEDAKKSCDFLSNIKHNNYLLPVMAALFAKENKCNDAIILNQYGRICETTISNVFIVKDEKISTPPLSEGCVAGTMRSTLLDMLPSLGFNITQSAITINDMEEADEIFITNALRPVRWIAACGDKTYENQFIQKLVHTLKTTQPRFFN